jgi:cytidine deaminase
MKTYHLGPLTKQEICAWLFELRARAFCPISHYAVAAVGRVRDVSGKDVYLAGVNVENGDHRLSTHAEEGVLSAMIAGMGAGARLEEIWAAAAPDHLGPGADHPLARACPSYCGKCRQQIAGLAAGPDIFLHAVSLHGAVQAQRLSALLPGVMTLENLDGPGAKKESVRAFDAALLARGADVDEKMAAEWLSNLSAHAPISGKGRAAVLAFSSGLAAAGAEIEDAAFLSINACQAALAVAAVQGVDVQQDKLSAIYLRSEDKGLRASDRQILQRVMTPATRVTFL